MSGGQRQRVALARAILSDPRILILDDATSAVDAKVEERIHSSLREVMKGRTTLLVAHRRSTLHLADRIAVLDEGRVVDVGHARGARRPRAPFTARSSPGSRRTRPKRSGTASRLLATLSPLAPVAPAQAPQPTRLP